MGQYIPAYRAHVFKEISQRLSEQEYTYYVDTLASLGFEHGWIQDWEGIDGTFLPDFEKSESWN